MTTKPTTKPMPIGSRYTGRHQGHADTTTGVYWEALPAIEGHALRIQRALLAPPRQSRSVGLVSTVLAATAWLRSLAHAHLDERTGVMRGVQS